MAQDKSIKEIISASADMYKDDVAFRVKTKQGKDPEYKDYISKVPYMDRLYNDYMKAILETPLQAGPEEAKLLGYE